MNFFEKAINAVKQPKIDHVMPETALVPALTGPVAQAQTGLVKKHVVVNPNSLLLNYKSFSLCENIPVAIESEAASLTGIYDAIKLPTKDFLPYLNELEKAPNEVSVDPANRVVYEIKLCNGKKMYIFPNLKQPQKPGKSYEKSVAFNVTPEINQVIVNVIKQFTRQK